MEHRPVGRRAGPANPHVNRCLHRIMSKLRWTDRFADWAGLDESARGLLVEQGRLVDIPEKTVVFGPGAVASHFLLLLSGTVRVQQLAEGGREIVLYRVQAGESCVLTTACLLADETYSAEGIAESPLQAVMIPRSAFDHLLASSTGFRHMVFSTYARRITGLMRTIEDIAFQRVDVRLAQKLLDLADEQDCIHNTHQQLASELGTAREVITRQLKEFQRRQWLELARGRIELRERESLQRLSRH